MAFGDSRGDLRIDVCNLRLVARASNGQTCLLHHPSYLDVIIVNPAGHNAVDCPPSRTRWLVDATAYLTAAIRSEEQSYCSLTRRLPAWQSPCLICALTVHHWPHQRDHTVRLRGSGAMRLFQRCKPLSIHDTANHRDSNLRTTRLTEKSGRRERDTHNHLNLSTTGLAPWARSTPKPQTPHPPRNTIADGIDGALRRGQADFRPAASRHDGEQTDARPRPDAIDAAIHRDILGVDEPPEQTHVPAERQGGPLEGLCCEAVREVCGGAVRGLGVLTARCLLGLAAAGLYLGVSGVQAGVGGCKGGGGGDGISLRGVGRLIVDEVEDYV